MFLLMACSIDIHPALNLAAWGVIDATAGLVIASGHLQGITQTIDRAELTSLLVALRWGVTTDIELCVWTDSQSTAHMAEYILEFDNIPVRPLAFGATSHAR